jgi:dUTP pyrophosphatase
LKVKIVNKSKHPLPSYETTHAAGLDLRANIGESLRLQPLERALIPTGIFIELPVGYEAQIRPRSGMAFKLGLTVLNTPGTIDADYRGEVKIILINLSNETAIIEDGMRIAQMIVSRHESIEWEPVQELSDTSRGAGGYGHTGIK